MIPLVWGDKVDRRAKPVMTSVRGGTCRFVLSNAIEFADKHEPKDWISPTSPGRRNPTPEQRSYLIGKQYQERKRPQGGTGANQYTERAALKVRELLRRSPPRTK